MPENGTASKNGTQRTPNLRVNLAPNNMHGLELAEPGPGRLGHLRLRHRVPAARRHPADRRDLLEGDHGQAEGWQPAAAHRRDPGRNAERDRPAERRPARHRPGEGADLGALVGPGDRQHLGRVNRRVRGASRDARRCPGHRRPRSEHLLPEHPRRRPPLCRRRSVRCRRDARLPGRHDACP